MAERASSVQRPRSGSLEQTARGLSRATVGALLESPEGQGWLAAASRSPCARDHGDLVGDRSQNKAMDLQNKMRDEKLMKHSEKITPVAAALSAVSGLACCVPSGIAAAAAAAGLGVVIEPLSPWLIGLSIALLVVGFVQLYRSNRTCQRRSPVSIALFLIAAIIVLGVLVFPQLTAGLFASVR
jgi:hypothetical protein